MKGLQSWLQQMIRGKRGARLPYLMQFCGMPLGDEKPSTGDIGYCCGVSEPEPCNAEGIELKESTLTTNVSVDLNDMDVEAVASRISRLENPKVAWENIEQL